MKYLKLFEDYNNDDNYEDGDDDAVGDILNELKTKSIEGIFYHGTAIPKGESIFNKFEIYSDYDAIWLANDEYTAEEFSANTQRDETDTRVVFECELSKIDNIICISNDDAEVISDYYGLLDIREAIEILIQRGFNGWSTTGSIGNRHIYDDYAIFDIDIINILRVKLYIDEDDDWTEFMSIDDANDYLKNK